eukprot:CAMPEP_0172443632 /NCGR_PEP_ID=MMETSP1065-20121228/3865_1 /TAXON_ID=265537 /ORGANISM="Amphiprora paludosa, Strain CCMP125" /LENGTH=356 /DNA_ID=CAMNT_0013193933 /DNA_START=95 /DNA_END=1165 /DNA_ORIENTATION=+
MGMNDSMSYPDDADCLDWDADFSSPQQGDNAFQTSKSSLALPSSSKDIKKTSSRRRSATANGRAGSFRVNSSFGDNTNNTELAIEDLFDQQTSHNHAGRTATKQQPQWDEGTMATATTCSSGGSHNGSSTRLDYFGSAAQETSFKSLGNSSSSNLTMRPTSSSASGGTRLQRRGRRIASRQSSVGSLDVSVAEESVMSMESADTTTSSKKRGDKKKKKKKENRRASMPTSSSHGDGDDDNLTIDSQDDELDEPTSGEPVKKTKSSSKTRSRRSSLPSSSGHGSTDEEGSSQMDKKLLYAKMMREAQEAAAAKLAQKAPVLTRAGSDEDALDRIKMAFVAKKKKERQNSNGNLEVED